MIGTAVGSYRIVGKVAEGGMGSVFRAEHIVAGTSAAIKILHHDLSYDRGIVDRFFNEARATSAIRHPGIVEVFDFGYLPGGAAFLVMEFLEGESLSRYLKRQGGRIPEADAAWLVEAICRALAAAHAKNIVHRDLKPDNVHMVPDPLAPLGVRPKLLDFGIAKLTGAGFSATKTQTGSLMGTPTYMSPEQCRAAGEVDHRADLYSLGCILYELLCGRPPFVAESAGELMGAHLYLTPSSPRRYEPTITADMDALVLQLLAKDRDHRPATASQLADHLAHLASTCARGPEPSSTDAGEALGTRRPSIRTIVDAPTVVEPFDQMRPSGPISGPSRDTMQPQVVVDAPIGLPLPPPLAPPGPPPSPPTLAASGPTSGEGPAPVPTPAPASDRISSPSVAKVTTLSGVAGVRATRMRGGGRARWSVSIAVIGALTAASVGTTWFVVRGRNRPAAGSFHPVPAPPPPMIDAAPVQQSVVPPPEPTPPPPTPPTPLPTPSAGDVPMVDAAPSREPARKKRRGRSRGLIDLAWRFLPSIRW